MGLASRVPLDRTTETTLLRQVYLAHFERGELSLAYDVARRMLDLGVLVDVCQQDVARVLIALGDIDKAVEHLRLAASMGTTRRRAFHLWTLGSVLYLAGRLDEAESVLERAARWATADRALHEAHLALVRIDNGKVVEGLQDVVACLEGSTCGQGYGRFVLGMLCIRAGRPEDGEQYLRFFVKGVSERRTATSLSLSGELAAAQKQLQSLALRSRCAG